MIILRTFVSFDKKVRNFEHVLSIINGLNIKKPKYYIYCRGSFGKVDYFEKLFKAYPELKSKCHAFGISMVPFVDYIDRLKDYFGNIPGEWDETQDLGQISDEKILELVSQIPNKYKFQKVILLIDSDDFHKASSKFKPIVTQSKIAFHSSPNDMYNTFFFPSLIVHNYNDQRRFFEIELNIGYDNSTALNWEKLPEDDIFLSELSAFGKVGKTRVFFARTKEENADIENQINKLVEEFVSLLKARVFIRRRESLHQSPLEHGIALLDDLKKKVSSLKYTAKGIKGSIGSYIITKKTKRNSRNVIRLIKTPQSRYYLMEIRFISFYYNNLIRMPLIFDENGKRMDSLYICEENKEEILNFLFNLIKFLDDQFFPKIDQLFPENPKWFKGQV